MSSTVLMKWLWPRMRLPPSGISSGTSFSSMAPLCHRVTLGGETSMPRRILLMGVFAALCLPAESLRIMTFNVRYPATSDGPNLWEKRRDLLVATIREKNPDVFGTQELFYEQGQYIVEKASEYQ